MAPVPVVVPSIGHAVAVAAAHHAVAVVVGELDGLAEPVANAGEVAALVVLVLSQHLEPPVAKQVGREYQPLSRKHMPLTACFQLVENVLNDFRQVTL